MATELKILEKYYDIARVIDPLTIMSSHPSIVPTIFEDFNDNIQHYHFGEYGQGCKQCLCRQVIQHKETFFKTEVFKGSLFMITAMPLEIDGRILVLELIKCISERALEKSCTRSKENTSTHSSITKLEDLVFRDALTNIYNRRYIDKQLALEIVQARQCNRPSSVMMIDIDFFKQVNDQFGHSVGDEVLQKIAVHLQKNIRQNSGDWVARYGGEEFLITLSNCSKQQAYEIAEKIRKIIEQTTIPTVAGNINITASFGVHTFSGEESDLSKIIDKVDRYLYQAKQSGRNCIVSAT